MMPPVTLVSGSRAEMASGSGDSELQVLDNVLIMCVRGTFCLPEALVIWKESIPSAVNLHVSKYLFSLYKTCLLCVPSGRICDHQASSCSEASPCPRQSVSRSGRSSPRSWVGSWHSLSVETCLHHVSSCSLTLLVRAVLGD